MKTSDLVSNSSLGQMTPDDVLGLVQDRLASARTGLMHVQMHKQLLERAVEAERASCLEIVKQVCSAAVGSESTRAGVYLPEILAEEIERQIRGEK